MNASELKQLKVNAAKVRLGIIEGVFAAKSGHPGGSLSAAEIFTYLYFKEMRIDPKDPKNPDRDRLVLSKGHCAPGLYSALAQRGGFDAADQSAAQLVASRSGTELVQAADSLQTAIDDLAANASAGAVIGYLAMKLR